MTDPATAEEYAELAFVNTVIDGYGLGVCTHMPCPFCAAPDWLALYPAAGLLLGDSEPNMYDVMDKGATCGSCGRSARWVVRRDIPDSNVQAELVQTGGPDPPSYLPPIRRIDA